MLACMYVCMYVCMRIRTMLNTGMKLATGRDNNEFAAEEEFPPIFAL